MANTNLTHQLVAREAANLLEDYLGFTMGINRGREDEFGKSINGYKIGSSVKVAIPPAPKVYSGATFAEGGAAADNVETSVTLTLDTQKHTGITFGAKEQALEMTEFKERYLKPQMAALASIVEADLISRATLATPNLVGSAGSVPTTIKTYNQAKAKLDAFLAPTTSRYALISSDANTEMIDASKALFNDQKAIGKQYKEGNIGRYAGIDFATSQSLALVTNGTVVAGVQVNGAGQTGSNLSIKGLTAAQTIKKGAVFSLPIKAVHPLTGQSYAFDRQFVVTADFTASGTTGSIGIFPPIDAAMPDQTVSTTAADSAALTFVGAVSASYRQNLVWQEGAFTAAFAPLPVLAGCEGYTATLPNGISVRVQTGGDFTNDRESTRIDVLYGFVAVRPDHACRVTE